jgi:hypothetical protein
MEEAQQLAALVCRMDDLKHELSATTSTACGRVKIYPRNRFVFVVAARRDPVRYTMN